MNKIFKNDFSSINIFNVVFFFFIVVQYIGILILYYEWDEYRSYDVTKKNILFDQLLFTGVNITIFIISYSFFKIIYPIKKIKFNYSSILPNSQLIGILILLSICIFLLYDYIRQVDNIALFVIFLVGKERIADIARSDMTNNFSGKLHWYFLFTREIFSFITYIIYANYLVTKKYKFLTYFMVISLCFSLLVTIEKYPVVIFILALIIINIFVKSKNQLNFYKFIRVFTILLLILTPIYWTLMGSKDFFDALGALLSRTFTGQIQPGYHHLEYFPSHFDFLYGTSFPNPGGIFPWPRFVVSQELMFMYDTEAYFVGGIVGSMPSAYWFEMYANFGYLGSVFSIYIGFLVFFIDRVFSKLKNFDLVDLGFFIYLMIHFKDLALTSLFSASIDFYSIIVFITYLFLKILKKGK